MIVCKSLDCVFGKIGSELLKRPSSGKDFERLPLLIKVSGKCTTDHISPAGKWLRFRGHLENISRNLLSGAVNAFGLEAGMTRNPVTGSPEEIWKVAAACRDELGGSVIVAEENYGEGSSREHAAMEPRFLGVKVVLAKSFARIHETNLKKQGVLALTFANPADYDLITEDSLITVKASSLQPGKTVEVIVQRPGKEDVTLEATHTYNEQQIAWFKAGSALACN